MPIEFTALGVAAFADRLAADEPVPGGGSAAAVTALLGISLLEMVVNLSAGRPQFAAAAGELRASQSALHALHQQAMALADEDAAAFAAVMAAIRLPKDTEEARARRDAARQDAFRQAASVPLSLARLCMRALETACRLPSRTNKTAASDLYVGALLLQAAAHAAVVNIMVNLPWLSDKDFVTATRREAIRVRNAVTGLAASVKSAVNLPL